MKALRFDTRDTKPKLRALLILTAAAAAVAGALILTGAKEHSAALGLTAAGYALGAAGILLWAFREQIRYNPYSYNTIFYMGFALFSLFIVITSVILAVNILRYPGDYSGNEIVHTLLNSAKSYAYFTFPFLFVFSSALCVSNIALLRHEGKRPVNYLGILLSILLLGGAVFLFFFDYEVSGSEREVMLHDLLTNFLAAIYLYIECMLVGTVIAGAVAARYEPDPDKDFVIILGCGLKKDGRPTPLLAGRIDRALAFGKAQEEKTGKKPVYVASGGQGPNEIMAESTSIRNYLIEKGVPPERVVEEDRSRDTRENMLFSKDKITAIRPDARIAFSTTNYHVFRSGLLARRVKMRAQGIGAKTKWYFWPNAAVREFAGLLANHRGKQALILGGMIAFYLALTLYSYR